MKRPMQLFIDGKPMGEISDFSYSIKHNENSGKAIVEPEFSLGGGDFKTTVSCIVPAASVIPLDQLMFPREPAGASHETLVKRLRYGGRKGRSARRRLLARGLNVMLNTGRHRVRGRAAMLDGNEILMKVKRRHA